MDVHLLYHTCFKIPRDCENTQIYQVIKNSLIATSRGFGNADDTISEYFIEGDKFLYIPRFYPVELYFPKNAIPKNENIPKKINIKFTGTPKNDLQKLAIRRMIENNNGISQIGPGAGKTVMSIAAACHLGNKMIMLCHRESLIEQWKDRFLQFTDARPEQIGILSTATMEECLTIKDIILATSQTFISIINNPQKFKELESYMLSSGIGTLIADEVHTVVGAPEFSKASLMIPANHIIGLSATPKRKVGFEYLLHHLGPITSYEKYDTGTMDPKVIVILADFEINLSKRKTYLYWEGQFQYARYYNLYNKSKSFYRNLLGAINICIGRQRDLVVMLERKKDIEFLAREYQAFDCGMFVGGVKGNSILKRKIILTTPGKMRDGVDAPWKDAMILTSNISNIEQAVGRINRPHPNKKQPILFDLVDYKTNEMRNPFWRNRYKYYIDKNWEVEFYLSDNFGRLIKLNEVEARCLIK